MTADSSAAVAAFAPWHPSHERARRTLRRVRDLVAHAELESYSVLTRLPAPFRVEPRVAAEYLARRYPGRRLVLPASGRAGLVSRLAAVGIAGGGSYDALIALTAAAHERTILTCDRRATSVYGRVGASFELV